MADRQPWQCPECKAWIRPDVETHWCDPDGGVAAERPGGPKQPPASIAVPAGASFSGDGGATSVTWTFPPGTTITETAGQDPPQPGAVTATPAGHALFQAVRAGALAYRARNRGIRSVGEARRDLGENPWGLSAG